LDSYALLNRITMNSGLFYILTTTSACKEFCSEQDMEQEAKTSPSPFTMSVCQRFVDYTVFNAFFYIFNETKDYQPKGGTVHSWRHASHFIFHRFHCSLPIPSFLPKLYTVQLSRKERFAEPPSRRMTVRLLRAVRGTLVLSRTVPSSFTGVAPSVHLLNPRQISKNAGTQTTNFTL
jgi:hypothetical protein